MNELDILIYLGKIGAFTDMVPLTTSRMGKDLNESQQNVSRWLIRMEENGLIYRKNGIKGYLIQITPEGENFLKQIKNEIESALMIKKKIKIKGKVEEGMKDGKYYMSLAEYKNQIEDKIGFSPFPGTLNIKITDMSVIRHKEKICSSKGIVINGFAKGKRVFGSLNCFPCVIKDIKCAVVIPERSHHPFDIIEIISSVNLREKLGLNNSDEINLEVDLNEL